MVLIREHKLVFTIRKLSKDLLDAFHKKCGFIGIRMMCISL